MSAATTRYGRHLWQLLPQHVRTRDAETEFELLALLDAIGGELDRLRGTLDQRLAEVAPGASHPVHQLHPTDPTRSPQEWLLPYMAALLDVRLQAPGAAGKQEEVQRAVRWRQGKGTLHVAEDAAEQVLLEDRAHPDGRTVEREAELLEGRTVVAVTPRVDLQLLPETSHTDTPALPADGSWRGRPRLAAQHPALPTVTPVVSGPGRAVTADPLHPQARRRELPGGGPDVVWRHRDRRAAPCFPWSHEDVAVRTPDVRLPARRAGWHHPKTVVALVAPPAGFFDPTDPSPAGVQDPATAGHPLAEDPDPVLTGADAAEPLEPLRETTYDSLTVEEGQLVAEQLHVRGDVTLTSDEPHRLTTVHVDGDVVAAGGPLHLADARVDGVVTLDTDGLHDLRGVVTTGVTCTDGQLLLGPARVDGPVEITAPGTHHLHDVVQTGDARVVLGPGVTLELHRCAVGAVEAAGPGAPADSRGDDLPAWAVRPEPVDETDVLLAVDTLLDEAVAAGRVTLDRSTVLGRLEVAVLRAADAILPPDDTSLTGDPADSCVRFSAVPADLHPDVRAYRVTTRRPVFWPLLDCAAWDATTPAGWGEPGCGVLHDHCPAAITTGAEDGGEMGAYHHRHHVRALAAVATKLRELLPVGITPIAVTDVRLVARPPQELQP